MGFERERERHTHTQTHGHTDTDTDTHTHTVLNEMLVVMLAACPQVVAWWFPEAPRCLIIARPPSLGSHRTSLAVAVCHTLAFLVGADDTSGAAPAGLEPVSGQQGWGVGPRQLRRLLLREASKRGDPRTIPQPTLFPRGGSGFKGPRGCGEAADTALCSLGVQSKPVFLSSSWGRTPAFRLKPPR